MSYIQHGSADVQPHIGSARQPGGGIAPSGAPQRCPPRSAAPAIVCRCCWCCDWCCGCCCGGCLARRNPRTSWHDDSLGESPRVWGSSMQVTHADAREPFLATYGELRVPNQLKAAWEELAQLWQSVSKHGVQDGAALTFKVLTVTTQRSPACSTMRSAAPRAAPCAAPRAAPCTPHARHRARHHARPMRAPCTPHVRPMHAPCAAPPCSYGTLLRAHADGWGTVAVRGPMPRHNV
jgi:hypothetical protein